MENIADYISAVCAVAAAALFLNVMIRGIIGTAKGGRGKVETVRAELCEKLDGDSGSKTLPTLVFRMEDGSKAVLSATKKEYDTLKIGSKGVLSHKNHCLLDFEIKDSWEEQNEKE